MGCTSHDAEPARGLASATLHLASEVLLLLSRLERPGALADVDLGAIDAATLAAEDLESLANADAPLDDAFDAAADAARAAARALAEARLAMPAPDLAAAGLIADHGAGPGFAHAA